MDLSAFPFPIWKFSSFSNAVYGFEFVAYLDKDFNNI